MSKRELRCDDVVKGCPFHATADDEPALLAKVAAHARDAHGIDEITPELLTKVKEAIRKP